MLCQRPVRSLNKTDTNGPDLSRMKGDILDVFTIFNVVFGTLTVMSLVKLSVLLGCVLLWAC